MVMCAGCVRVALGCLRQGALGVGVEVGAGLGWPVESVRARGLGWPVVRLVCVCPAGWARCGRVVVSRVCFRSPFSFASVVEW